MAPGDVIEWAKASAILGGVIVGIYAVFSPAYVWHQRQLFGWGAGLLCGFGTVLIVASIFHTVTFTADMKSGVELRLAAIEDQLTKTNLGLARLDKRVTEASSGTASISSEQIARLQQELKIIGFSVQQVEKTSNAALSQVQMLNTQIQTDSQSQPKRQNYEVVPFDKNNSAQPNFGIGVTPNR